MGQILHGAEVAPLGWLLGLTTISFMLFFVAMVIRLLPAEARREAIEASLLPLDEG
jgi:cbb3-type cytochrome oxidase subunit 3